MSSEESNNNKLGSLIEASDFAAPGHHSEISDLDSSLNRSTPKLHSHAAWWHSQFNLMLCVFALLGVASVLFIVLTPAPEAVSQSIVIDAQGDVSLEESRSAIDDQAQDQVAPYSEAQRNQARGDSQAILSNLLESQKVLEEKEVKTWAQDAFEDALSLAALGDEHYKQQDYQSAIAQYKAAVEALEAIHDRIPAEIQSRIVSGLAAVADGKSDLARARFQSALVLDQNHIPALQGLQRVDTLDQVLALLSAANADEQDFLSQDQLVDIQAAKQKYRQASDLDSQFEAASLGVQRATELEVDKLYRQAMSQGFNALFAGRYSVARARFNAALKHKPDDQTASSALRQSLASDKRTSLATLLSQAKSFERNEEWASALSNYQTVLQRDRNQVGAKVGRIRTQARVDLDASLKRALEDPLALSRSIEREKAQSVLDDARGISKKGPILSGQIAALDASLQALDKSIKVAFKSDSLTQVSLKKVGAKRITLGRFDVKKLALKPGRYTLIGSRLGFRDVRTDLELTTDMDTVRAFTIVCNEPIIDAG